jgi:hypothetical protein
MIETPVKLNKDELTVLICSLNYMTQQNEVYLQMNYTDVNRLYNKLYSVYESLK